MHIYIAHTHTIYKNINKKHENSQISIKLNLCQILSLIKINPMRNSKPFNLMINIIFQPCKLSFKFNR